ncbi:MAG: acyltransferase [Sphingobacteriales bacterium]|nr:acyltransferase [Sphingobacteriales bacterium]
MKNKLPGLNGLRAIAASLVLVTHVFQIAGDMGDARAGDIFRQHAVLGTEMVNLFFVISGFIITYILYKEKNETGAINLYQFYVKRALRIWPLYFGIILIVFVLTRTTRLYEAFPELNRNGLISLTFFILTFHTFISQVGTSVLPHYWSLSVEEQFYIFWPPLFKFLSKKGVLIFCLIIISGMAVVRNVNEYLNVHYSSQFPRAKGLDTLFCSSMFGSVAIGAIGAWMLVHKNRWLSYFYNRYLQIGCWFVLLLMLIHPFHLRFIHFEITAFVSLVLVLNVTSNGKSLFRLDQKWLDRTGMISYGIYMFHWPLIPVIIFVFKETGLWSFSTEARQVPLLLVSYLLTWVLAWYSYRFVESRFLRMRPAGRSAKHVALTS